MLRRLTAGDRSAAAGGLPALRTPSPRQLRERLGAFAIDLGLILVVELVISLVYGGAIAVEVNVGMGPVAPWPRS